MRINSEFKDYYDVVMGEGQDQTLVYQRHRKEEDTNSFPFHYFPNLHHNPKMMVTTHNIGFCGKVYPVLEIVPTEHANLQTKFAREHRRFCYTLEDVDNFVRSQFKKDDADIYFSKKYFSSWGYGERQHNFESFFKRKDEYKASTEKQAQPYFENLCPVFVATYAPIWTQGARYWYSREQRRGKIVYNGSLKEYEFFRIFPPYQAFQEINMWLNNQAVPIKPIPEIPNEVMAEIKGFDKFSFRKDPSSKKRKRK